MQLPMRPPMQLPMRPPTQLPIWKPMRPPAGGASRLAVHHEAHRTDIASSRRIRKAYSHIAHRPDSCRAPCAAARRRGSAGSAFGGRLRTTSAVVRRLSRRQAGWAGAPVVNVRDLEAWDRSARLAGWRVWGWGAFGMWRADRGGRLEMSEPRSGKPTPRGALQGSCALSGPSIRWRQRAEPTWWLRRWTATGSRAC
eukprot:355490-Chlamydomonas_euryale.AAC.11